MSTLRRVRALYGGIELWVEPGEMCDDTVREFEVGRFPQAPHAHVFLCGSEETAGRLAESLGEISERRMMEALE